MNIILKSAINTITDLYQKPYVDSDLEKEYLTDYRKQCLNICPGGAKISNKYYEEENIGDVVEIDSEIHIEHKIGRDGNQYFTSYAGGRMGISTVSQFVIIKNGEKAVLVDNTKLDKFVRIINKKERVLVDM